MMTGLRAVTCALEVVCLSLAISIHASACPTPHLLIVWPLALVGCSVVWLFRWMPASNSPPHTTQYGHQVVILHSMLAGSSPLLTVLLKHVLAYYIVEQDVAEKCGKNGSWQHPATGERHAAIATGADSEAKRFLKAEGVAVLCRELRKMSSAGRTGSGTNTQLAKLTSKVLADNQGLFDIVTRHGFILGEHANQFESELTAEAMVALAKELEIQYDITHDDGVPPVLNEPGMYNVHGLIDVRRCDTNRGIGRQAVHQFEYLVRWQGYNADHDTWEPASKLPNLSAEMAALREKRLKGIWCGEEQPSFWQFISDSHHLEAYDDGLERWVDVVAQQCGHTLKGTPTSKVSASVRGGLGSQTPVRVMTLTMTTWLRWGWRGEEYNQQDHRGGLSTPSSTSPATPFAPLPLCHMVRSYIEERVVRGEQPSWAPAVACPLWVWSLVESDFPWDRVAALPMLTIAAQVVAKVMRAQEEAECDRAAQFDGGRYCVDLPQNTINKVKVD